MTETTWFWIGTIGMALGAVVIAGISKMRTQDEEGHKVIHTIVPILAAVSYLSMAFGQGGVRIGERTFWFARYVDWSATTPLLLLALSMTALHGAHRRRGLVAALLGADALMIVTGLFSGLSEDPAHRWTWFIVSCGAFVAVYAVLFGPLRREALARDPERRTAYAQDAIVLSALWLLYPVIVLLGPDGTAVWSPVTTTALIAVVDLLAKVAYGIMATRGTTKATNGDLARGGVSPVAVTDHGVPSDAGDLAPTP